MVFIIWIHLTLSPQNHRYTFSGVRWSLCAGRNCTTTPSLAGESNTIYSMTIYDWLGHDHCYVYHFD